MKSLEKITINRKNSILIIVDMENEFCKPGGKICSETSAKIMPGVISSIAGLTECSRRLDIPVVYIQSVRTLNEAEFTIFGKAPFLKIGTWAVEIVAELKPIEGDIVVQKFCHDPFYNTRLDSVLQKLVPEPTKCHAILTGGAVNICLYHAAMGFYLRHYLTVVPVDSVYYMNDSAYLRALEQFSDRAYHNIFLTRSDLVEFSSS